MIISAEPLVEVGVSGTAGVKGTKSALVRNVLKCTHRLSAGLKALRHQDYKL